jgi:MFS family permease
MKFRLRKWLPASTGDDGVRLIITRALRGFADGAVSVLLPSYLLALDFDPLRIAAIVFGTLLGSAALTLWVGLATDRLGRRRILNLASVLMFTTGLGFALATSFPILFLVAVIGTMNPSPGDVSLFLPIEQAALAESVATLDLTSMYASYNVAGAIAGALGALASGIPAIVASCFHVAELTTMRASFIGYSLLAVVVLGIYRRLSPAVEAIPKTKGSSALRTSRPIVIRLAALFSLDSFGGGFVIQSLLALWLLRRFHISLQAAGTFFFVSGLLSSFSQLLSPWLATRIGRINTMVMTHLPANAVLILAALMPTATGTIVCLLIRAGLSQMDVPARQSYVMAVVPPEERAAAASVTNVPRSLATALAPLPAGAMLARSDFGWPLICAGVLKIAYDLMLLSQFRKLRPPDEESA